MGTVGVPTPRMAGHTLAVSLGWNTAKFTPVYILSVAAFALQGRVE